MEGNLIYNSLATQISGREMGQNKNENELTNIYIVIFQQGLITSFRLNTKTDGHRGGDTRQAFQYKRN